MKKKPISSLTDQAVRALHDAVAKVVDQHRRHGRPLAVWQDGKAVWQQPETLAVAHEATAPYRTRSHGARS